MKGFEYFRPKSVSELIKLLLKYDGKASILAGGTDLLVMMKQEKCQPEYIISLKGIPNLSYIREQRNGEVKIGTMTIIREIECSPLIKSKYPLLAKAAGLIGSPQVRWRATCGGNLCNGAPSADLAPPLICLGAKAVIQGRGKRIIPLEHFFLGPGKVNLKKGEFLRELIISYIPPNTFGTYLKFTRSSMDIAIVGVAVLASFKNDGECSSLRISLGAVAPTPMRAIEAEKIGLGNTWNGEMIDEMARLASDESKPIDDVRGSIFLRKRLIEVLTRRALAECLEQAQRVKL